MSSGNVSGGDGERPNGRGSWWPSAAEALRRLVGRGWLRTWQEGEAGARMEGRPPRTYFELSREGRHAAAVLLGEKGAGLVGRACPR